MIIRIQYNEYPEDPQMQWLEAGTLEITRIKRRLRPAYDSYHNINLAIVPDQTDDIYVLTNITQHLLQNIRNGINAGVIENILLTKIGVFRWFDINHPPDDATLG